MSDEPESTSDPASDPIAIRRQSDELARVPVQTTVESPALPLGGRADVPIYSVVLDGELDPPARRRAAALAGVSEQALRDAAAVGPVVLSRGTSEVRVNQTAASYRRAGLPVRIDNPTAVPTRTRALAVGIPVALTLSLLIAGLLPVAALSTLLLVAATGWVLLKDRGAGAEAAKLDVAGDIVDRDKALDADASAGSLVARVQQLRRDVVEADANDRVEADLLDGLDEVLQGLRTMDDADADARARLGEALSDLEGAVRAIKGAGAGDPGAAIEAVNARAREAADASLELKRRLAQAGAIPHG